MNKKQAYHALRGVRMRGVVLRFLERVNDDVWIYTSQRTGATYLITDTKQPGINPVVSKGECKLEDRPTD